MAVRSSSRSLVANASAFYFDWDDQQVQNPTAIGLPTANADSTRSRGFDLSLAGRPTPGLDLFAGVAYTDAEFRKFDNFTDLTTGALIDVSGNRVPFASEWTVDAAAQYIKPLTAAVRAVARLDNEARQATGRWLNNRAENSHQPFRRRERAMAKFRSAKSLQKFASIHSSVHNHFNQERQLYSRQNFKHNRSAALAEWRQLAA
ncbi:MAG: TonB-dependent receptor [Alphaproteobacteria bacterium]|nr:TonB-dependent receptor [Alphaproteobacteria bacterium]